MKPEVFFVTDGALEYKCWARTEEEKRALLKVVVELQDGLREKTAGGPMSPGAGPRETTTQRDRTAARTSQPSPKGDRPSKGERVPF